MTTRQSHKRRGATFETDLVRWFRDRGYQAERLRLAGTRDEGDLRVDVEDGIVVVEAKAPGAGNSIDLAGWIREAHLEAANFARARGVTGDIVTPVVVIKARGKSLAEAYVVQRLGDVYPDVEEN